jgi:hypothetical protein
MRNWLIVGAVGNVAAGYVLFPDYSRNIGMLTIWALTGAGMGWAAYKLTR